jgi:hypothetical protein
MTDPRPPRDIVELRSGQALLEEALAGLRGRLTDHREALFESLEASLNAPMREAFSRAREAHEQLALEAGLSTKEEETREPDAVLGTALTRYREGVRLQVLEPLRSALKEIEVGREVSRRWQGFRDGLPGLADSLPHLLYRQEPDDLFGKRAVDGEITAFRKRVVRGWRRVRGLFSGVALWILRFAGRERDQILPPVQTVPLRALARECLLGIFPLRVEPFVEDIQQHFARPVADVETAVAAWTEEWFSAEEAIRMAEGHLGTRFQEEVSRDLPPPAEAPPPTTSEDIEAEAPTEEESSPAPQDQLVLQEISRKLGDALEAGGALSSPSGAEAGIREAMEHEWDHLLEEIRVAGSFQATARSRTDRRRVERLLERGKARARIWEAWHQNAPERLFLSVLLLRLRESLGQAENHLMGRIVEEALAPLVGSWNEARGELQEMEDEAAAVFAREGISEDTQELARAVDTLRVRAEARVGSGLAQVMEEVAPLRTVRQVGDRVAGDLADALRYLPESIPVTPLQEDERRVIPTVTVRHVPFREAVLQTVDVLRLEALRNSTQPLTEFLQGAAEECREIPNIVSFNLTAARDELLTPPEGPLEPVLEDARSLTVDGLVRTAAGVETLLRGLLGPWREFTQDADDLLRRSFKEIHTRAVAEGAVQEQMLDLRARVRAWVRRGGDRAREWARWLEKRASRSLRRWRARGARLVHLGRAAVGTPVTQEGEAERAMETLRGIPQLLDSLPLVYRRLYSFHPVSDPNLLVGRESEMEWVARRLAAWKGGAGIPCLLTGPVGVGHTSFLNVLADTHLEGYRVFRVTLDRRISTEESLAPFLAEALDIGGQDPWTLARLEGHLLEDSAFQHPTAVLLEHLEHLFLRVPGGTDLLESFISLLARTSGRVFWISNTSGAAWKVLEKSEPRAAALLTRHPLPVLSRPDLESLIMVRHRRSGLPVEFVQPGDLNALIRRRLRRTRGDKAKQEIIREDFFDRIFRMSEGNVAMAILLWLRAADFSSREGWLRVVAPRPLRFAFLEELDLTMDFALKGFLEHGTLTLEEYGKVFGTGPQEAFQVFETLRSRMLLESLGTRGGLPSPLDGVREGERYRVPGILSQVVANRLRNRNILH